MTKSVLITGASRGLGEGLARQFAARGYKLALTARKLEDLESLTESFFINILQRLRQLRILC